MSDNKQNSLNLVQQYQALVLRYEALDTQIDDLIMANDGSMENMSKAELQQYRQLAQQRSEVRNDMRILEQQLSIDEDD
jgi:hypothetical protein